MRHRAPAIVTASLCSAALAGAYWSGTSCDFVRVSSHPHGLTVVISDVTGDDPRGVADSEYERERRTRKTDPLVHRHSIGVFCDSRLYEVDRAWSVSRAFLGVALVVGFAAASVGWAVATVLPPTERNWRCVSLLSAASAVLQVPVFLIFDSTPCTLDAHHECQIRLGCFVMVCSCASYVAVTIVTQWTDPPRWAVVRDAWKIKETTVAASFGSNSATATASDRAHIVGGPGMSWIAARRVRRGNRRYAGLLDDPDMEEGRCGSTPERSDRDVDDNSDLLLRVTPDPRSAGFDRLPHSNTYEDDLSLVPSDERQRDAHHGDRDATTSDRAPEEDGSWAMPASRRELDRTPRPLPERVVMLTNGHDDEDNEEESERYYGRALGGVVARSSPQRIRAVEERPSHHNDDDDREEEMEDPNHHYHRDDGVDEFDDGLASPIIPTSFSFGMNTTISTITPVDDHGGNDDHTPHHDRSGADDLLWSTDPPSHRRRPRPRRRPVVDPPNDPAQAREVQRVRRISRRVLRDTTLDDVEEIAAALETARSEGQPTSPLYADPPSDDRDDDDDAAPLLSRDDDRPSDTMSYRQLRRLYHTKTTTATTKETPEDDDDDEGGDEVVALASPRPRPRPRRPPVHARIEDMDATAGTDEVENEEDEERNEETKETNEIATEANGDRADPDAAVEEDHHDEEDDDRSSSRRDVSYRELRLQRLSKRGKNTSLASPPPATPPPPTLVTPTHHRDRRRPPRSFPRRFQGTPCVSDTESETEERAVVVHRASRRSVIGTFASPPPPPPLELRDLGRSSIDGDRTTTTDDDDDDEGRRRREYHKASSEVPSDVTSVAHNLTSRLLKAAIESTEAMVEARERNAEANADARLRRPPTRDSSRRGLPPLSPGGPENNAPARSRSADVSRRPPTSSPYRPLLDEDEDEDGRRSDADRGYRTDGSLARRSAGRRRSSRRNDDDAATRSQSVSAEARSSRVRRMAHRPHDPSAPVVGGSLA